MKALFLLSFVVYTNAQLAELSKGFLIHLGPFDTSVQIGNSTSRYIPLTNNDVIATRNARNLVEEARRMFKTGFNNLPPLDPYTSHSLPTLSLDSFLHLIKGNVYLSNLVIDGAKQFAQNLLELRLKSGRVDFGFTIPLINFNVDYRTDAVLADLLPVQLKGHLSLVLSGVKIVGNAVVRSTMGGYVGKFVSHYQMTSLQYRLHIDDVALQLQGSNAKINQLIKDSVLLGVDLLEDIVPANVLANIIHDINIYAAKIVMKESNHMLMIASADQILAYLLPEHIS